MTITAVRRLIGWVLLCSLVIAVTPPAGAQERAVGSGGLQIVEHTSSTGPAGTVRIVVRLPGVFAADDTLTLTIHEPVSGEPAFNASTRGEGLGGILNARVERVAELSPDAFGRVELIIDLNPQDGTIPAEPGQVRLVRPGVYPVTIELRTVDQDLVGHSTEMLEGADQALVGVLGIL